MKNPIVKGALFLLLFILIFASSNINWGKERWKELIQHDAVGYYAYLPAYFIYHDLQFGFIDQVNQKYHFDTITKEKEFRQPGGAKHINKYYCGTAVAELPFFFSAHILAGWFGYAQDGYSKLYYLFINLAAIFYLFAGLIFCLRLLAPLHLNGWQTALLLYASVFGTNIFYYTVIEPGMSHIYSFAFISGFLYCSYRYFATLKPRYVILMALMLGMVILIRPVNMLSVLLLPFLAGSAETLKTGFRRLLTNWPVTLLATLVLVLIVSIQLLIYKFTAGKFFIYSYGQESFYFLNPHFFDFLFSYKKGLFVYTPLFFVALAGSFYLFRANRFRFLSLIGFQVVLIYVLSSWWCWWYGGSFSCRPILEYSFTFMFLLGCAFKNIRSKVLARAFYTLVILLTMVCQFQTYQYRKGYIHWEEMTKEKYWAVFLRPDKLLVSSKK